MDIAKKSRNDHMSLKRALNVRRRLDNKTILRLDMVKRAWELYRCLVHLAVENFTRQVDLLDCSDDLQEDLSRNDMADDIGIAKHDIDLHNKMRKNIMKTPVEGVLKNEKCWWC
ncbi:hypothetical protein HCN44_011043 [Aphidius gifuensis]|uniref:Uncharacterized protein n=1 Tax=Aphidius gifuensis TaxID=684658 RepID=A0A834XK55_APHGI|nr:hypothetical protein HCN44_011043 [Aphidius gifuensis]